MGPLCAGMSPLWWSDKHNKRRGLQLKLTEEAMKKGSDRVTYPLMPLMPW